ncbi:hypothetical protein CDD80_3658 [Ophiocordyceps camponoti-rufipedis]|uniref:Carboxylesterase type B domain-containing protein n=1 Tax=Ophiocordyceps camponoti-rufipedis TaxID=2004952 RepID=A0A2C5Z1B7_9HYPO|nr:hypothetical protein CDD80_3658 [Ophiocordyceps camponoti-rufipedis]
MVGLEELYPVDMMTTTVTRAQLAYGDFAYIAPVLHTACCLARAGARVYVYEYSAIASPLSAASHGDHMAVSACEAEILRGRPGLAAVGAGMAERWTAFAATVILALASAANAAASAWKNSNPMETCRRGQPRLPWVEASEVSGLTQDCGYWDFTESECGTERYCEAYDDGVKIEKTDFLFRNMKECLDAHEPKPSKPRGEPARGKKLPWNSYMSPLCDHGPGSVVESLCGTYYYCLGFAKNSIGKTDGRFDNVTHCLDAHVRAPRRAYSSALCQLTEIMRMKNRDQRGR